MSEYDIYKEFYDRIRESSESTEKFLEEDTTTDDVLSSYRVLHCDLRLCLYSAEHRLSKLEGQETTNKAVVGLLKHKYNKAERRCIQLEKTLRWLKDAVSNEQDEVISAVLRGEPLETAIKESQESENSV